MRHSSLLFLSVLLVGACASPPKLAPVPEKYRSGELSSPECKALGGSTIYQRPNIPVTALKYKQDGWAAVRFDVDEGHVVKAELVESSPEGLFEQVALDASRHQIWPSGNAKACFQLFEYHVE
jgi:hypothetical protein